MSIFIRLHPSRLYPSKNHTSFPNAYPCTVTLNQPYVILRNVLQYRNKRPQGEL